MGISPRLIRPFLLVFASLAMTIGLAGPLDPPAAPAPTDGVRGPGTPISALPFSITQGGYYYVTRPLAGTGADGITISASNVTLDLGGFTLTGNGSGSAVNALGGVRNITVRNGATRTWSIGINLGAATQSLVERVQSSSNASSGIIVSVHSEVRESNASLNNFAGIYVTKAVIRNSSITENQTGILSTGGSVIRDVFVSANTVDGINLQGNGNSVINSDILPGPAPGYFSDVVISGTGHVIQGNRLCTVFGSGPGAVEVDNVLRGGC